MRYNERAALGNSQLRSLVISFWKRAKRLKSGPKNAHVAVAPIPLVKYSVFPAVPIVATLVTLAPTVNR